MSAAATPPSVETRSVETRAVETRIHGYFLERVPEGDGPFPLLVGFHGYAEAAEDCLQQLERIPGASRWLLCAVQGLSAFYNRRTGTVVASWMTRFERERAITDNLRFVDRVLDDLAARHPLSGQLVYLGFSQGVAMAYRAAAFCRSDATGLVALAGDLPPDVAASERRRWPRVLVARGDGDSGYPEGTMVRDLATLAARGVAAQSLVFPGGHEFTPELHRRIGEFLSVSTPEAP